MLTIQKAIEAGITVSEEEIEEELRRLREQRKIRDSKQF